MDGDLSKVGVRSSFIYLEVIRVRFRFLELKKEMRRKYGLQVIFSFRTTEP